MRWRTAVGVSIIGLAWMAGPVAAQSSQGASTPDRDRQVRLAEPDFTLVALPTTLRVPKYRTAFRLTHRFARPLGQGDFGDLVGDLFGLDSGAQIGLEVRFGVVRGGQVGVHRTNNRTIAFFGQYDVLRPAEPRRVNVAAIASIEGTNNFRDRYTHALGGIVSYTFGTRGAAYIEPMWVNDANLFPRRLTDDRDAFILGLGARVRIRPTVYVVGEVSPRVAGYNARSHQGSIGIEKRAGGHLFQLNVSNGFGTTFGQLARGGASGEDWYLGFNVTRKFF